MCAVIVYISGVEKKQIRTSVIGKKTNSKFLFANRSEFLRKDVKSFWKRQKTNQIQKISFRWKVTCITVFPQGA